MSNSAFHCGRNTLAAIERGEFRFKNLGISLTKIIAHTFHQSTQHRQPSGQIESHTPSIAFRHLPPNSARIGYVIERTLLISGQLSTDAVSALQKVWVLITLRASLFGTFLQTLPDLVTPLKGHSLPPRRCPATRSAPLRKVRVLI